MATLRLKFTPEALTDVLEASDYYESCSKGLGRRFKNEVKRKLISIKDAPQIYAIRYGDVRFALVDIFPYSIHFTIMENEKYIQIHSVLCQYRSPDKYWKKYL